MLPETLPSSPRASLPLLAWFFPSDYSSSLRAVTHGRAHTSPRTTAGAVPAAHSVVAFPGHEHRRLLDRPRLLQGLGLGGLGGGVGF